ncbi:hypothetical protein [Verminephrobacter eiseniae]|uniref:hypothetical protein n=1 Tax=Verminephrobacter eiseniae TaxID=364317 RepID=UPI002237C148|nr:hypothetical protein [Verminephrobacter eiseniae]MCW5230968.1 hypothetical protein [Verminephrobacter eiseniae]MCW5292701.1 hypothetical protein [Verminephrobacter eiseniae]MCW8188023.1 hypothetical protein [Verminephrobacter eiseniae]MCW8226286.1 hypothetical protein [Verminephrobacter eiseniae]MCW8237137.1 hypothetical protein [Verminephrobacter eiseniae]
MAKDEADQKTDTSAVGAGLDILERAWNAQWALRLACVLLFFDMAMLLHVHRGVSQWPEVGPRLLGDIGWLAIVFVAFSVLAAVVAPAVFLVVRHFGALAWYGLTRLLSGFLPPGQDARPDYSTYVSVNEFRDLALEEKDEFLYRLYEDDQRRKKEQRQALERLGDLMAAVLVAGFADWLLGSWTLGGIGLVSAMESAFGDWMGRVTAVVLLCVLPILKLAWFPSDERNVIYYPPLARKLRDKERKSRGLM